MHPVRSSFLLYRANVVSDLNVENTQKSFWGLDWELMNALPYGQNVNLREFWLPMTESAIWSEIAQGSQGSQDTNNKWACRKPTASLITPIDPSPPPHASLLVH